MDGLGCLGVVVALALLLAPFASLILAWGLRRRVQELEERTKGLDLHDRLGRLGKERAAIKAELARLQASGPLPAAPSAEPQRAAPESATPATKVATAPAGAPLQVTTPVVAPPIAAPGPPPVPPPETQPPAAVQPAAAAGVPPAAEAPLASSPAQPGPGPAAPRVPPAAPAPRPAPHPAPVFSSFAPPPPSPPKPAFDWERLVGVKLFSWIAGVALVVAAVFFLRYSVEQGWLGPPVRLALGLAVGVGLLIACELKAARRYPVTANALDAAGIAILFATLFAAHVLWGLLALLPAFLLLALVTAVAVLLSIRRDSLFIALLGLVGGFATPVLLASAQANTVPLFGYLALLNLGLAWLAARKGWPALAALSLAATTLYQWQWVVRFLDSPRLPLGLGIFLLFPALFAAMLLARRTRGEEGTAPALESTAAWAAALPLAFAVYLATVPAYADRYLLLFGFLGLLVAGLAAIAIARGPGWLHLAGAGSTLLVFALWFSRSYGSAAWPVILALVAAFAAFFLAIGLLAERRPGWRRFAGEARAGVYAAPLLFFAFPVLAGIESATAGPALLFGALALLLAAVAGTATRLERPGIYVLGAAFVVLAEWVWIVFRFTPERLLPALTLIAGFALFFLAVPFVARRLGRADRSWTASLFFALSAPLLMLGLGSRIEVALAPMPLLAVLALLALAFTAAALAVAEGSLLAAGLAACQVFLVMWIAKAEVAPWPGQGAVFATLLAALAVGAFFLARRRDPEESALGPFTVAAGLALFLGQAAVMVATVQPGYPGLALVAGLHLALVVLWLVLAATGRHQLAVLAVVPAAAAMSFWQDGHFSAASWTEELLFAGLLYAPFAAYPLVLGRRALGSRSPYLAAILATVPVFFFGRHAILAGGGERAIGLLPVALAAVLAVVLWRLLALEPLAQRDTGRLATVVGAVLALVTVAIPLQLEKQWITVGWALLAAALVWAYRRLEHRGLLWWATGLFAAVFVRLAANPAVLSYHPRSEVPILNWYLYTYLVAAASLFLAVWLLKGEDDELSSGLHTVPLYAGAGTVLLFLLLNIEIADYFSTDEALTFGFISGASSLAEDLAYTIGWGIFAMALLGAGLVLRHKAVRVCAIVLLSATVLKAFLYDLSRLGGLYRVASFVGLAVCLLLVALLLQRFVLRPREGEG